MRMLFKWVIPWSDRVYNAFSHVKSPLCCKPAQRQGRARAAPGHRGAAAPSPAAGQHTQSCFSSRCPEKLYEFVKSWGMPALRHFFKKAKLFFFAAKPQSICTMFWCTWKGKNYTADVVIIYQQKWYSHHSPKLLLYRAKQNMEMIPSFWALLFHMKNELVKSKLALDWGTLPQTTAKPYEFFSLLPQLGGFCTLIPLSSKLEKPTMSCLWVGGTWGAAASVPSSPHRGQRQHRPTRCHTYFWPAAEQHWEGCSIFVQKASNLQ